MTTEQRKNRGSESRRNRAGKTYGIQRRFGRGSWIRTNDLQYPKLRIAIFRGLECDLVRRGFVELTEIFRLILFAVDRGIA